MSENNKHREVGETNKLSGIQNYNVWKIKMEAILKREKLWFLVETKQTPTAYLVSLGGVSFQNKEKLDSEKQGARSGLILFIADNPIGLVAGQQDPADSWDLFRRMYNTGDQQ